MTIINFTQHNATTEQVAAGVVDAIPAQVRAEVLTFSSLPTVEEIWARADKAVGLIAPHAEPGTQVMVGGAPFFMSALEAVLKAAGFKPVYAFSERVSMDVVQPDGTVVKTSKFAHKGFVEV